MIYWDPNLSLFFITGYLILYGPKLVYVDIQAAVNIFLALLCFFSLFRKYRYVRLYQVLYVLVLLSLSLSLLIWHEFEGVVSILKLCIYIFSATLMVDWAARVSCCNGIDFKDLLIKYIFMWGVIDSLIPIAFYLDSELLSYISPLIDNYMLDKINGNNIGVRFTNLSIGGGTLSLMYLISFMAGLLLVHNRKIAVKYGAIGLLLLFMGMILTGRIGLFFSILLVIVWYSNFVWKTFLTRTKLVVKVNEMFFLALISLVAIYAANYLLITDSRISLYAFEFLLSGDGSTKSLRDLYVNHLNLKYSSIVGLLLGHGNDDASSDVGYINFVYMYGLLLMVAAVLFYFSFLFIYWKRLSASNLGVLCLGMLLMYPVISIKQFVFVNSKGLFLLYVIVSVAAIYRANSYSCVQRLKI